MNKSIKLDEVIARAIQSYLRENKKQLYEQKPGELVFIDSEDDPKNQTKTDDGGEKKKTPTPVTSKKDSWGRPPSDKAFGFNEKEKKFTEGPNKGKTWNDVYPQENPPKKTPDVKVGETEYEFSFWPTGKYGRGKRLNGYQMRAKELYDCKSTHVFGMELFNMDLEELYLILITGSKSDKTIKKDGKVIGKAKYRGIDSKQEWKEVNKALERLTGERGITLYADSFVRQGTKDFWGPYFDKVGSLLGGDGLKAEMTSLSWNAGCKWSGDELIEDEYGYGKKWTAWKNYGPDKKKQVTNTKLSPEEQEERLKQQQKAAETNYGPWMPLWVKMAGLAIISIVGAKVLGKFGLRLIRGAASRRLDVRAVANMTEAELNRLHNWVRTRYEMTLGSDAEAAAQREFSKANPDGEWNFYREKISEAEYRDWLKFYQNRNKLFMQRREALAEELAALERGEITVKQFIGRVEVGFGQELSPELKAGIEKYEREVLRKPKRAPVQTTPKPKPKTKSSAYKQTKIGFQQGKSTNKGKKP